MKKIKSIKQLKEEKKRLKQQQIGLENKIQTSWNELKEQLKPANMATDTLNEVIKKGTASNLNDDSILKNTFTYGVTLLAKKIAEKAEIKLNKIFKKQHS